MQRPTPPTVAPLVLDHSKSPRIFIPPRFSCLRHDRTGQDRTRHNDSCVMRAIATACVCRSARSAASPAGRHSRRSSPADLPCRPSWRFQRRRRRRRRRQSCRYRPARSPSTPERVPRMSPRPHCRPRIARSRISRASAAPGATRAAQIRRRRARRVVTIVGLDAGPGRFRRRFPTSPQHSAGNGRLWRGGELGTRPERPRCATKGIRRALSVLAAPSAVVRGGILAEVSAGMSARAASQRPPGASAA